MIAVVRHGDRAPVKFLPEYNFPVKCVHPIRNKSGSDVTVTNLRIQDCEEGDLTEKGVVQLFRLGEYLKSRYRFSNAKYYSSNLSRTIASMHSLIMGLEGKSHVIHVSKSFSRALTSNFHDCPRMARMGKRQKHFTNSKSKISAKLVDNYQCFKCHDLTDLQSRFSDKAIKQAHQKRAKEDSYSAFHEEMQSLQTGRVLDRFLQILAGDDTFSIVAAHDDIISSLITLFHPQKLIWPPYASLFVMEIFESADQKYYRIVFNSNVLAMGPFSELVDILGRYSITKSEYLDKCK